MVPMTEKNVMIVADRLAQELVKARLTEAFNVGLWDGIAIGLSAGILLSIFVFQIAKWVRR